MKQLWQRLCGLYRRYEQLFWYLVVGVLTTLLNAAVYYLLYRRLGVANVPATGVAWLVAVMFAFWANKWFVFSSKKLDWRTIAVEMGEFFGCRLGTGLLDVAIMYVTVDRWHWYPVVMKIISDFIVTVINYLASKIYIFKERKG